MVIDGYSNHLKSQCHQDLDVEYGQVLNTLKQRIYTAWVSLEWYVIIYAIIRDKKYALQSWTLGPIGITFDMDRSHASKLWYQSSTLFTALYNYLLIDMCNNHTFINLYQSTEDNVKWICIVGIRLIILSWYFNNWFYVTMNGAWSLTARACEHEIMLLSVVEQAVHTGYIVVLFCENIYGLERDYVFP